MRWFLFFVLFLVQMEAVCLRDYLLKGAAGDYIVVAQNQQFTLLAIRDKNETHIAFEEVNAPQIRVPSSMTWREWLAKDSPGFTSWIRYRVNLQNNSIDQFSRNTPDGWCDGECANPLFSSLLCLNLEPVPPTRRKKAGYAAISGSTNPKTFWHPRMTYEGQIVPDVPFEALEATWPRDGSELAGKHIVAYLPEQSQHWPSHFPYWLEVADGAQKVHFKVIDSGCQLYSYKQQNNQPASD